MNEQKKSFWPFRIFLGITASVFAVFLLVLVAVPNFVTPKADNGTPVGICRNNLRQIDSAANQFALEHHLTKGDSINFPNDLTPYIKLNSAGKIPGCPQGGIYTLKKVGNSPTCSLGSTVTPAHGLP